MSGVVYEYERWLTSKTVSHKGDRLSMSLNTRTKLLGVDIA